MDCAPCARVRAKAWQAANPERVKVHRAAYKARHRDRLRAENLAYYHLRMATDPEGIRKQRREWAKTEKGALANRLARHARRGAKATPEAVEYAEILLSDPCAYCGGRATELDHINPVSLDGSGDWENFSPACRACNARKHDKRLLQFLVNA